MSGSGQIPPPRFVPGGDGCSSVSGRQKSDFRKNSSPSDKNDRVGSPISFSVAQRGLLKTILPPKSYFTTALLLWPG
jgi:hypothetical protein